MHNQKAFINLGRNLTNGLTSVKRADCILADNSIENSQQAVNLNAKSDSNEFLGEEYVAHPQGRSAKKTDFWCTEDEIIFN